MVVSKVKDVGDMKELKRWGPLYLLMLPGILYLIVNNYIPMAGIVVAFKKYRAKEGVFGSPWIGLENFKFLFQSGELWLITRNTLLYNLAFLLLTTFFAIVFAVLISDISRKHLKKLYQSAVLLPFLISMVIVSYIVFGFLNVENGFINHVILPLFGKPAISWYSEPNYWPFILVLVHVWRNVGYSCLIYIAGIAGIDGALYEAAALDGAGKLKQIWYITLPALAPSIITLTLMHIGKIFYSDFGLFYQVPMDSGLLYPATNVIDTYVYRALIKLGNIGMSSAAGVFQSMVGFLLVLLSNWAVRKTNRENALF